MKYNILYFFPKYKSYIWKNGKYINNYIYMLSYKKIFNLIYALNNFEKIKNMVRIYFLGITINNNFIKINNFIISYKKSFKNLINIFSNNIIFNIINFLIKKLIKILVFKC